MPRHQCTLIILYTVSTVLALAPKSYIVLVVPATI